MNISVILPQLIQRYYITISQPILSAAKLEEEGLGQEDNLVFVKQRRLIAKFLVIILRDFSILLDDTGFKELIKQAWALTIQNLIYIMPFFQERILFASEEQR